MGLTEKTVSGVFWTVLGEIVVKFISPLSFLVLTRILSPEDFGIVAIATTLLMLIQIITDLGTSKVLVQLRCSDIELNYYYNSAFYFNVFIGILIFFTVFIFSQQIADYNNQPNSAIVIRIMSVQILFYSLSTVQIAIKNREMDFKSLFYIRLITVAAPALVSIPIAFAGGGFWAIVGGSLVGSFLNMLALWRFSSWKPALFFQIKYIKNIIGDSLWSSSQLLIQWIPISLDTYLLSNYLSVYHLGLYSAARGLFTAVSALFLSPIIPVMFSSLSKIDNEDSFIRITLFAQKVLFCISALIAVSFFIYREIVSLLVFNQKWDGIASVIGVIFVLMGFEYFYSVILEAVRSKGLFKELAINNAIGVIIAVPLLFISCQHGLMSYVMVRCLSLYLLYFGVFYLSKKHFNLSFRMCLSGSKWILICALSILIVGIILESIFEKSILYYVIISSFFVISLFFFYNRERLFVCELYEIVNHKVSILKNESK